MSEPDWREEWRRDQAKWREEWRVMREEQAERDRVLDEKIRQLAADIDAWHKPE
jgi:hypothetical protein